MPREPTRGRLLLLWWMRLARPVAVGGALAGASDCGSVPVIVLGNGPGTCQTALSGPAVTLQRAGTAFTVSNGLIAMTIGASGQVTALSKNGTALMASGQTMYVSSSDPNGERIINATTQTVVTQTSQRVELSFVDTNGSMNWDLHYVMQSGLSGFYYYLAADTIGKSPIILPELRTVQRFDPTIFVNGYNAERHGSLPSAAAAAQMTNANAIQDNTWQLPDAGLLPGTPGPDGPVYTSYDWATYVAEDWNSGHGLYGSSFGAWLFTASPEYVTGGPMKQELMVEDGNIILNVFNGGHFGTAISTATPANWRKVYGPSLLYVNAGTEAEMIADAATQAAAERAAWPYCWVNAPAFPTERATVDGTLSVTYGRSAAGAVVTLADPGELYLQAYGYMYWSQADANGNFAIPNVRPGTYVLHAYATEGDIAASALPVAAMAPLAGADAGAVGDDAEEIVSVTVAAGATHLGALTWAPIYHPNRLWIIGTSDRRSGEFLVSGGRVASATLREYGPSATQGLWDIPPANLTYTIGTSTPAQDWYFAQSRVGTWNVVFGLDAALSGNAYLTLAIAGVSQSPQLAITINGHPIFNQTFGNDGTLYRSALVSGRYQLFTIPFPASYLAVGNGTNTMSFALNAGAGGGIMYDFLKLESD